MARGDVHLNRDAIESIIAGRTALSHVKPTLRLAAHLAEDLLLATGHMTPDQQGVLWIEAKRSFMDLELPAIGSTAVANQQASANKLRQIAALADEDLTMDPRVVNDV